MKNLNGYWIARLVVKWLIPVMYFVIANVVWTDLANGLAGLMALLVLAYYGLVWQKEGENKWQ